QLLQASFSASFGPTPRHVLARSRARASAAAAGHKKEISTMKLVNTQIVRSVAAILTFGLFWMEQPALGHGNNCKEARGTLVEVFTAGGKSGAGTLSNAGWGKAATLVVFTGPVFHRSRTTFRL